jgi:hypothetical protein
MVPLPSQDQRVDFHQRSIGFHVALVELGEHVDGLATVAFMPMPRPASGLRVGQAGQRIDNSVMIFSGVLWATSSMSMPPSLEAIRATFCVARSVTSDT